MKKKKKPCNMPPVDAVCMYYRSLNQQIAGFHLRSKITQEEVEEGKGKKKENKHAGEKCRGEVVDLVFKACLHHIGRRRERKKEERRRVS